MKIESKFLFPTTYMKVSLLVSIPGDSGVGSSGAIGALAVDEADAKTLESKLSFDGILGKFSGAISWSSLA